MKVLLIGGGGRECALAWKLSQSPELSTLYVTHDNPGFDHISAPFAKGERDHEKIAEMARKEGVDLAVIGPEAPLAEGAGDAFRAAGVPCFGPDRAAARLETSKSFMKEVCAAAGAPTAAYGKFTDAAAAKAFLRDQAAPYVVKADGLAAGKGVVIAETLAEADKAVDDMLGGAFGKAGAAIVIEEFMAGEEASLFVLTDGEAVVPMAPAQDHKRAFDGDKGPNTGGMGAYSPTPAMTADAARRAVDEIVAPIVAEMARRGAPYVGVVYAGLMIADGRARLVEINARFGDPECQVLMRRLTSDLLPALHAAATGALAGHALQWTDDAAALVVMAAKGYPGAYEKGSEIAGVEAADALPGVKVFHAGTRRAEGRLLSNGGRVLNVTATGADIAEAVERAYQGVAAIDWPGGFYRKDIGWRALERGA